MYYIAYFFVFGRPGGHHYSYVTIVLVFAPVGHLTHSVNGSINNMHIPKVQTRVIVYYRLRKRKEKKEREIGQGSRQGDQQLQSL